MAGNPLIDQGVLNRIRANLEIPNFPELNITAETLTKEGMTFSLEGASVQYLENMTGASRSLEPYQMVTGEVSIPKTSSIVALYKAKYESDCSLGPVSLISETTGVPDYDFQNFSIVGLRPMKLNGTEIQWVISMRGTYAINNSLFNLT